METILDLCAYAAFFAVLIIASIIDIKRRIIPNWVIFSTVFIWLIWSALEMSLTGMVFPYGSAICALMILLFLLIFTSICEKISKRYLFGGGDIKLVSASTLFLGLGGIASALFVGSAISLIYAAVKLPNGIPFAPCLFCGALISLLAS